MHLAALELTDFRAYASFRAEFSPDIHLLVGENGAGKTSLLEAVHYLSTLKSFRGGSSRELVRLGQTAARVAGRVEGSEGPDRLEVIFRPPERIATVDGKAPPSIAAYLRLFPTVKFTPEDVLLWKGEAASRRKALDRAIFGLDPGHFDRLTGYARALRQRNAWLRAGANDTHQAEVWTAELAERGAPVVAARLEYLERLRPHLAEVLAGIGGAGLGLAVLSYRGLFAQPTPTRQIEDALRAELASRGEEERRKGFSLAGPHRDDLEAEIGGRSMKRYASQGQHRLFALAAKIAEIELFRKAHGGFPVLLLDDVQAELDPLRVERLFHYVNGIPAQTFITATRLEVVTTALRRPMAVWEVHSGLVERMVTSCP